MKRIEGRARSVREFLDAAKYTIDFCPWDCAWQECQVREFVDDHSPRVQFARLAQAQPEGERRLGGLTPEKMAHLRLGEAYLWSSKATDEAFCKGAIKVKYRPRVTQHGGATKTAVGD